MLWLVPRNSVTNCSKSFEKQKLYQLQIEFERMNRINKREHNPYFKVAVGAA